MTGEDIMRIALDEARIAESLGEIPIGAVITFNNEIVSRAHNLNRTLNNPTRHAEMIAIEKACLHFNNERLTDCDLYVTKEPCAMCSGAIIHSRIKRVFFGCRDVKYGACGTVFDICGNTEFNHIPEIIPGILEEESAELISSFFRKLRNKKSE